MIVRSLRLHPFGCFADRDLSFAPGLSVVLGPNEAGKSTFFRALRHVLFVTSALSKPGVAKYVAPYLPLPKGDTIRVRLEFDAEGGRWTLARSWGASAGSELRTPAGAPLTAEAAVQETLARLLPASPGAFEEVLLAGQARLAETVESLAAAKGGVSADLADILRAAVLGTGGVSVDRFRALLAARVEEAFSNWDRASGRPRENRGIERPWKKQVGVVLQAFYAKDELRAKAAAAREWETGLDRLSAELGEAAGAAAAEEAFVAAHGKAAAGARERETLEAQAGKLALEMGKLKEVASGWPGAVEKARGLAEAVQRLSAGKGPLEKELEEARRGEQDRALRDRVGRVQRRKEHLAKARQALAAVAGIERKALEEIRAAARDLERLQDGLAAGKLSVTVAGRKDTEVSVQEDFAPAQRRPLSAGSVARLSAAGRIRIVHPDLEIEVHSGEADGAARAQKAGEASVRLDDACRAAGVPTREEAESRWSAFEPLAADAAAAEKSLAEELGGEMLSDFERRAAALGPERPGRQASVVAAELATLAADIQHQNAELERLGRQVQEWHGEHGSFEKVIEKLADARGASKTAADRTAKLAPLPAGFATPAAFLGRWEAARESAAAARVRESGLRGRICGMQDAAPEQSSEEISASLAEAEAALAAAQRRGEALLRIEKAAEGIAGASDAAVGTAMRADLEKSLAAMTGGRYASVQMEGTLPSGIVPAGGVPVGRKLLSAGTADSLALALRLVMARHFLAEAGGFMAMDDPLVEMDPSRQHAAAAVLREFAVERQLIVFTCHPATAELLGGTLVEL